MRQLKPIEGSELTEYVINLLQKNNIRTAIEFLTVDENKLTKITNLPEAQISALKVKLRRIYGPQVVDALHYCCSAWRVKYTTGIESLDALLGDELRPGRIYELCGYSGTGKSRICHIIAMNFAWKYNSEVFYVDTMCDFKASWVMHVLNEKMISKEEVGRVMHMIKFERCYNLRALIKLLENLLESLRQKTTAFKLVIIDSLPAVWYLFHGEDSSRKGKILLTKCANLLKQIAKEHQLLVLCTNHLVRSISDKDTASAMEVEDLTQEQQSPDELMAPSSKPSLGKCWDGVPTIRLTIEDPYYEAMINEASSSRIANTQHPAVGMNKNQRVVRVVKSCFSPTGAECTITLDDAWIH